jgi:hypothetical protein
MRYEAVYPARGRLLGPEGEIPHTGRSGGIDQGRHLGRGGVLQDSGSGRSDSEALIEFRRPFRAAGAIQNPYSIDHLTELPGLPGTLVAHSREVIAHFPLPECGEPPTRKPPDDDLCAAPKPAIKRPLNPLIMKDLCVAIPAQALLRAPVVIRHDNTALFIHERAPTKRAESRRSGEPCPGAIRNRPITNMADSA